MLTRVFTTTTNGLTPVKIEVEVCGVQGIPGLHIIGLPSKAIDEAKERVSSALTHCGVKIRAKRTIVNLAPADLQKQGSSFELAIAVGLLKMYGELTTDTDDTAFFGELSLDGVVKPIRGALPYALGAKKLGFKKIVFPQDNYQEVSLITDCTLQPISHIKELLTTTFPKYKPNQLPNSVAQAGNIRARNLQSPDISDVLGQHQAKRALEIAAAGSHNVLLIGPPGAGKSMLAWSFASLLPSLTPEESLESTSIHSLRGDIRHPILHPPFRQPHHSVSLVGLVGGGKPTQPGEISLAHNGVLFLDEFPEFSRDCIESLRQPLESHSITITRAQGTIGYPAKFILIAAANPCPCGFYGSGQKPCRCTPTLLEKYRQKFSGPILDRIDLHVRVETTKLTTLHSNLKSEKSMSQDSNASRKRIVMARTMQRARYTNNATNNSVTVRGLKKTAYSTPKAQELLLRAGQKLSLSARAYYKLLRVSRTIADLAGSQSIEVSHVAEAVQYRSEI